MSDISVCSDENEEQDLECDFDKTLRERKQGEKFGLRPMLYK